MIIESERMQYINADILYTLPMFQMDLKEIGEKHLPESLGKAKTEFVSRSFLTNGSPKHSFLECVLWLINDSQKQGLEVFWQMILSAAFRLVCVGHELRTRCSWRKMLLQFFV